MLRCFSSMVKCGDDVALRRLCYAIDFGKKALNGSSIYSDLRKTIDNHVDTVSIRAMDHYNISGNADSALKLYKSDMHDITSLLWNHYDLKSIALDDAHNDEVYTNVKIVGDQG